MGEIEERNLVSHWTEDIDYADRFNKFLQIYSHPDRWSMYGEEVEPWKGTEIEKASNGEINRQYVSSLKNGKLKDPGHRKLVVIAKVMGFPIELWHAPEEQWEKIMARMSPEDYVMPEEYAVNLGEVYRRHRNSHINQAGKPFSHGEIAAMTGYRLTEKELEELENGTYTDPGVDHLLALSDALKLPFSAWFAQRDKLPHISEDVIEALKDQRKYRLLQICADLSDEQFAALLVLAEHYAREANAHPKYEPPSVAIDLPLDEPLPDSRSYARILLDRWFGQSGPESH